MNPVLVRFRRLCLPLMTLGFLAFSACEGTLPVADAVCSAGMAQIGIGDGYQEILCGCQETAGTPVLPPSTMTCTITHGSIVVFSYLPGATTRQIVPVTPGAFADSPTSIPDSDPPIAAYAVKFDSAGSYNYKDNYLPTLTGTITAL